MQSKSSYFTTKQTKILSQMGEQIKLARLRRKLSLRSMAERAGIAVSTLGNIEKGSGSVALGAYMQVLSILGLAEDLLLIAAQDPLGRQIQDAALIAKKRAPKAKKQASVIDYAVDKGNNPEPHFS